MNKNPRRSEVEKVCHHSNNILNLYISIPFCVISTKARSDREQEEKHKDDIEVTSDEEKEQSDNIADEDSPDNDEELQDEQSVKEKESDKGESEEDTDEYK